MEHSFFDVTRKGGVFEIQGLAPGTYTLEAWHEVFGTLTQEITVTDKNISDVKFTFKK
jgi:hypothetical protein